MANHYQLMVETSQANLSLAKSALGHAAFENLEW